MGCAGTRKVQSAVRSLRIPKQMTDKKEFCFNKKRNVAVPLFLDLDFPDPVKNQLFGTVFADCGYL